MNLISVNSLHHSEGGRPLFENITIGIEDSDRIAVIGRNGSGKTTLLKILAGIKSSDDGEVVHNRQLTSAFLEQAPEFNSGDSIADFILSGDSAEIKLIREYETITAGISDNNVDDGQISEIMAKMDHLDCWSLENRVHSILTELGISNLKLKMAELSGGMIKKAAIARTLVVDSNLLILDEPTNHLDIKTINWLEKYIKNSGKALLLVTHDRYFMDSVCSRIIEIDERQLYSYDGNYSRYIELKSMRDSAEEKKADRISNILRNEAEWIMRGPRARAGKDKKRKERFFDLMDSRPAAKSDSDSFSVEGRRLGGKILELENVGKSFGTQKLFEDFSFSFKKGDKIGILGPNGSGKTSLLNIIAGRLKSDTGRVDVGVNTKIGYYDQLSKELPGNIKAADFIKETAEVVKLNDGKTVSPSQFLERFLFPKNLLYTEIANLSGGEKKKLYLLKLLLENPNFLIFDEPTNDFDIQTLSILEDFLENFTGCAVVVSHDRFFLDRATDFFFVLDGSGAVAGYSGDVSSFYDSTPALNKAEPLKPATTGKKTVNRVKKGLSFNEKKELQSIEDEIMMLETEKEELDKFFMSPQAGQKDLSAKKSRYDAVGREIEDKYSRWEYLEAKKG